MKALTLHGTGQIKFESLADPEISDHRDALVKVAVSGLCGSDLHVYRGHEKGLDPGTAMGHEFVGEIIETGKEVRNFKKGDWVMSPFTTNCGQCYFCSIGLTCRCIHGQLFGWVQNGKGLQGAQAEYVRVPLADHTLMKLPTWLSKDAALFLGDNLPTGYFCADQAQIRLGGIYIVIGCGSVGLTAIWSAFQMGSNRVFAIDSVPERLKLAKEFGAEPINYLSDPVVNIIMDATKGIGVDAVMEAVGNEDAISLAFRLIRPGGIISSVGVHTGSQYPFSPVEAYDKNLTLKTGRCPARYYMRKLLDQIAGHEHELMRIVSHRMPLENGVEAYEIFNLKKDKCLKVLFEL